MMGWRGWSPGGLVVLGILAGVVAADDWSTGRPEEKGIRSAGIVNALESLREAKSPIHALLVIRDDTLVFENYWFPFPPEGRHDIASCTKTVNATLLAIAMDQGLIAGADAAMVEFFSDRTIANLDDRKRAMTLADLLTMRSGFFHVSEGASQFQMFHSPDWVGFILNLPVVRQPGTRFEYFSPDAHLLSAIGQSATGKTQEEYAREVLFGPLGIKDYVWPTDPQGYSHGWGDLRLTARDLARLGLLYLHNGTWRGKRIVTAERIREFTKPRLSVKRGVGITGYGYQIWTGENHIAFRGRGGQRVFIYPEERIVVTTLAGVGRSEERAIDRLAEDFILPAAEPSSNPVPIDASSANRIAELVALSKQPPDAKKLAPFPPITESIWGRRYRMEANPYIEEFCLTQGEDGTGQLEWTLPPIHRSPPMALTIGWDGVSRLSPGRGGEPAAVHGHWSEDTLHLDFDELGNINRWEIMFRFEEDRVQLTMRERTDLPEVKTRGRQLPLNGSPDSPASR